MKVLLTLLVEKSMFMIKDHEYMRTGKLASKGDIDRWSAKEIEIQGVSTHSMYETIPNETAPTYIQCHPKKGGQVQTKLSVWMYYKQEVEIF